MQKDLFVRWLSKDSRYFVGCKDRANWARVTKASRQNESDAARPLDTIVLRPTCPPCCAQ